MRPTSGLRKEQSYWYRPVANPLFPVALAVGSHDQIPQTPFVLGIEQTGQSTVVVNANLTRGTANVTLNPPLKDSNLNNYRLLLNVRSSTSGVQVMRTARGTLGSTTNLQIEAWRNFNTATLANSPTGVTVAGGLLANVSGMALTPIPNPTTVSDAHGNNGSFFDHAHDAAGLHPVTDPQHNHAISSLGTNQAQETFTVDWVIIHS